MPKKTGKCLFLVGPDKKACGLTGKRYYYSRKGRKEGYTYLCEYHKVMAEGLGYTLWERKPLLSLRW